MPHQKTKRLCGFAVATLPADNEQQLTNDADISTLHITRSNTCMPEGIYDSSPPLAACNLALEKPESAESDSKVSPSWTAK